MATLVSKSSTIVLNNIYFFRVMFKIHDSWGGMDADIVRGIMIAGTSTIVKSYTIKKEKSHDGYGYYLAKIYSNVDKQEFTKFLGRYTTRHTEYAIL